MSHRAASSELVQGFFPQWILRASFIKISTRNEPAGTTARIAGFVKLPVRYVDLPGVKIHPNKIPEPLRDLLPFARQWCFVEEEELYAALDRAKTQSIQSFVDSGNSKDEQLYDFCFRQDLPTPVPDEVVLMQTMYHNLEAARSRLALMRPVQTWDQARCLIGGAFTSPLHNADEHKAEQLARQIAKHFAGKKERFPKALSSLGAFYRVRAKFQGMNLHIHVGDALLTIWVQNFRLSEPFLMLAANEPERASLLLQPADVGLNVPVFINDELYCNAELVRQFCRENSRELNSLRLRSEERLSVQRCQLRLRLVTDDVDRLQMALETVDRIFHRYAK